MENVNREIMKVLSQLADELNYISYKYRDNDIEHIKYEHGAITAAYDKLIKLIANTRG